MARKRTNSKGKSDKPEENKRNSSPTSKSGASKTESEYSKEEKEDSKDKAKNDPEWYARDPQLMLDAARLTFSEPFGARYRLTDTVIPLSTSSNLNVKSISPRYSGIYTYTVKSSIGNTEYAKDPANVASAMLYANVRYVNSGRKNYDPADLYLYTLSIAELYAAISYCQKLYACAFMYSQKNQFVGREVLHALDIDADDLRMNLANFRAWINTMINKISSFAVPAEIPYFYLKVQMYSSIYIENGEDNIKDQLYQVKPQGFYKFTLDSQHNGAGMLTFMEMINPNTLGAPFKYADLVKYMESLLANIWADEDFGLISGDVHKAFDGRILQLMPQADDAGIVPVFDPMMLEKFHNARVMRLVYGHTETIGSAANPYNVGDIYQLADGNLLHHEYVVPSNSWEKDAYQGVVNNDTVLLDIHARDVDPSMVVESTRWTSVLGETRNITDSSSNTVSARQVLSGTEIVTGIDISVPVDSNDWPGTSRFHILKNCLPALFFTRSTSGGNTVITLTPPDGSAFGTTTPQMQQNIWRVFALLGGNYTPITHAIGLAVNGSDVNVEYDNIISQLSNYTYTTPVVVSRLHEVAMLSLLSVPGVAKVLI